MPATLVQIRAIDATLWLAAVFVVLLIMAVLAPDYIRASCRERKYGALMVLAVSEKKTFLCI